MTSTSIDWASRANPGDQVNPVERGEAEFHKVLGRARVGFNLSGEVFEGFDIVQDVNEMLRHHSRSWLVEKHPQCSES